MDDAARPDAVSRGDDDTVTLLALGVLAYTLETMIHEALGHGGVCLAQGHHVTVITPLWMRCDVVSAPMVAMGPGANAIAAFLGWIALRTGRAETLRIPLFIWLCFVFNGFVAAGYLGVGGATDFGDWAYLFDDAKPAWLWRVGAVAVAGIAYWMLLRSAVKRYVVFAGQDQAAFARRSLAPAVGAGVVAVAAQLYGQGLVLAGLILPIACTLVVGASLWSVRDNLPAAARESRLPERGFRVRVSPPCVILALGVALAYVCLVGPGLR